MEWIGLLAFVIIVGALVGGNSLGETIRKGLGCLAVLLLIVIAIVFFGAGYQA